jgi:hypothetical protein
MLTRLKSLFAIAFAALTVSGSAWAAKPRVPFGTNGGSVDFVDVVKQSLWDDMSSLDGNGWPLGDNSVTLLDARHNMPWNGPDPTAINPDISGTYHLSLVGQAVLSASTETGAGATVQNQRYDSATNTTTADVVLAPDNYLLSLSLTATKRLPTDPAGTGFTNLRFLRPGTPASAQQVFTDATLRAYSPPFVSIRFLDTDGANDYAAFCPDGTTLTEATWANRVHVTDAVLGGLPQANAGCDQAHGYPWEYMIMLANAGHHDMWINVPVDADDDYVRQLATLIKLGNATTPGLDPDLHVYVEYSNEVWNSGFPQQPYNQAVASQEGITEPERYLERTVQIAKIFQGVWGANSLNHEVRPVALWQFTTELTMQAALRWSERHFQQPVNQLLWGIGEAPYYNPTDTSSVDNILDTLVTGSDATRTDFIGWQAVASFFGIKEVGYESGPSLSAYPIYMTGVPTADRDPRIRATMVHHYLDNWYAMGADLVNFFTIRGTVSPFQDWFLYEDNAVLWRSDGPKLAAALDVLAAAKPAPVTGYVLPWSPGVTTGIDPSQHVPFPFAAIPSPGSGLTISPLADGDPAFNTYDYLLRATGTGTHAIQFWGHSDGPGASLDVYLDDVLKGTVSLPQGSDAFSTPVRATLGAGFHTMWLVGGGTANTVLPPAGGVIRIQSVAAAGFPAAPSAPHNLSASALDATHISLTWASTTMASGYTVKRSRLSGGPYAIVGHTSGNSFVDQAVVDGVTYYYVVSATNAVGESAPSPQVPAVATAPRAPDAPTGLQVVRADASWDLSQGSAGFLAGGEILLRWNAVPEATSYTLIRTPCLTGAYEGPCPIATQLANVTSYIDIGQVFFPPDPQVGINYTYTVQANNSFGSSSDSNAVSITPSVNVPDAPARLTGRAIGGGAFLTWTPPFGMLPTFFPMQYNVYRSDAPGGPFALVAQVSTATFFDKSVASGSTYHYVVTAAKSVGESPKSNRVRVSF